MRSLRWRAILGLLLGLLLLAAPACGHRYHHWGYYSDPYYYDHTFALTLVNDTNQYLIPGPIVAYPGSAIYSTLPAIPPGGSSRVVFDFVPSAITVGARAIDGFTYVYPTQTLEVGHDYDYDSYGVTFVYR